MKSIAENYLKIRREIPEHACLVCVTKTRTAGELLSVIEAGATDIGENYVEEAYEKYKALGDAAKKVRWHLIGHLQSNKAKKAVSFFDVIQTVDSLKIALAIDKNIERADIENKKIQVYIQVNIGCESQKYGIHPDDVKEFTGELAHLKNLSVAGLMAIEPYDKELENSRAYFKKMKKLFDEISLLNLPSVNMKVLSMGMSSTYNIAAEEGSNMVRVGTGIFGGRR